MGYSRWKVRDSEELFSVKTFQTWYIHNTDDDSNESVERDDEYEESDRFVIRNNSIDWEIF